MKVQYTKEQKVINVVIFISTILALCLSVLAYNYPELVNSYCFIVGGVCLGYALAKEVFIGVVFSLLHIIMPYLVFSVGTNILILIYGA